MIMTYPPREFYYPMCLHVNHLVSLPQWPQEKYGPGPDRLSFEAKTDSERGKGLRALAATGKEGCVSHIEVTWIQNCFLINLTYLFYPNLFPENWRVLFFLLVRNQESLDFPVWLLKMDHHAMSLGCACLESCHERTASFPSSGETEIEKGSNNSRRKSFDQKSSSFKSTIIFSYFNTNELIPKWVLWRGVTPY